MQRESREREFEETQHLEEGGAKGKGAVRERIHFIDALRGYAILMMLQGHIIDTMLAPEYRDSSHMIFQIWSHMRGMTAAVFLFSSGLIVSYLLFRGGGTENERFHKTWKRGLWLMLLISLSPLLKNLWHWYWSGEIAGIRVYPHSSVIYLIGYALILSALIAFIVRYRVSVYLPVVLVISVILFFFGGWINHGQTGIAVIDFFNQKRAGMMFTIAPWLGHFFVGGFLGALALRVKWYRDVRVLVSMIVLGLLVKYCLFDLVQSGLLALGLEWANAAEFHAGSGPIYRHGEVLIVAGSMAMIAHFGKAPSWLQNCGKETLTIFMLHLIVVYGAFIGFGYATYWKLSLDPWSSALLAAASVVSFAVMAQYLPAVRKKIPLLKLIR